MPTLMDGRGRVVAGRYRLESRLHHQSGETWRAWDARLERPVAVRFLRVEVPVSPAVGDAVRAIARLEHPHVVRVLDRVEDDHDVGLVFEFVPGETLAERMRSRGPLPVAEAAGIMTGVLRALEAAHDLGIAHSGLSPSNVVLTAEGVKVGDFAVAVLRAGGPGRSARVGNAADSVYVAPEQRRDGVASAASDLYAVGAMMHEAVTGLRPPAGRAALAEPVAAVIERALQPDPDDRYSSAWAMRAAVEWAIGGGDATVPAHTVDGPPEPTIVSTAPPIAARTSRDRPVRGPRRGAMVVVGALAVTALAAGAIAARAGGAPSVPEARVPAVVGLQIDDARARLESIGVRVDAEAVPSDLREGAVVAQGVAPGTPLDEIGDPPVVGVQVSAGPTECCRIPDVRGASEERARERLAASGFVVGEVHERASKFPEGQVIEQLPAPGGVLDPGATVHLVVAVDDDDHERDDRPGRGRGRGRGHD